jgi:hypothetical protein
MKVTFQKYPGLFIILAAFCVVTASCQGSKGGGQKKDTIKNVYGSANDTTGSSESTVDTSKVISADNSSSGGTKAMADTGKLHKDGKK